MRKILVGIILCYQKFIAPYLGPNCRFFPSCSDYTIQSIEKNGCIKGTASGIIRMCKCHPLHPGGYDPV